MDAFLFLLWKFACKFFKLHLKLRFKILNDVTDLKIKFSHITVKVYAGDSRVPVKNVMREYNSFIDTSKKNIYMQYIYYNYLTQGL